MSEESRLELSRKIVMNASDLANGDLKETIYLLMLAAYSIAHFAKMPLVDFFKVYELIDKENEYALSKLESRQ